MVTFNITDYITIKTGYVHIYIEIFKFNEYIPSYITCYVAHAKVTYHNTLIFKQLNKMS